jgi:tRNA(Leu) C34 or U34 (ribose-2'-O)-methylase TrmL
MNESSISIGLCNPKSVSNVGSVLRAAGCYGAKAIYFTGQRFQHAAKYSTDTKNQHQQIVLQASESLIDSVDANTHIVCVELVEGAIALPAYKHPDKALYIFGPEDGSISQALINQSHDVVYIPTTGCMNLAATVNVVLYDRLAKSAQALGSDDIIRQSRDTNNKRKVKK